MRIRVSWGVFVCPLILLACSMAIFPMDQSSGIGPVFGMLGAVFGFPYFALRCWLYKVSRRYELRARRLRIEIRLLGLAFQSASTVEMRRVHAISVVQGLWGRLLGYGHIHLTMMGGPGIVLRWIAQPRVVAGALESASLGDSGFATRP